MSGQMGREMGGQTGGDSGGQLLRELGRGLRVCAEVDLGSVGDRGWDYGCDMDVVHGCLDTAGCCRCGWIGPGFVGAFHNVGGEVAIGMARVESVHHIKSLGTYAYELAPLRGGGLARGGIVGGLPRARILANCIDARQWLENRPDGVVGRGAVGGQ